MNLLGITWGMGARDVGMKAAVSSAQNNVDKFNKSMEEQSKIAGKSKVKGFFDDIREGFKEFNIASIAQSMRALTGDTGNLSNSLESMAVANAKAAKPFVASLNLTGKEARRMTSRISAMAISMNVGAEVVAETFKTMAQATGPAKEALDALGYSERDWVKITETTGIKAADLTDVMGGMGALWKVSAKEGAGLVNRLTDLGKKAGLGLEPMKKLKENVEALAKPFEGLGPELQRSGAEMMGLAESAVRMGGVFRELGASEEEATALGQQTAQMFAQQAVQIEKAMKYGEGELTDSPLFKWLTTLGVGMDEAINIVETGSRDSVKGMQMIQDVFTRFGMGGAQQQAMLSQLSGALGESAAGLGFLAQNTDAGAKALERMSKVTSDGKFSLKDYANEAFSTGRTLQESLDLMKQSFETRFRAIARKDVVRFVGDMGRAYKDLGDRTKELAGDPTWGPLVKRLSAVNQLGTKGLFINLDGKSNKKLATFSAVVDVGTSAIGSMAEAVGPAIAMISQLAGLFGPLLKGLVKFIPVWGWVAMAIAGVVTAISMVTKGGGDLGKWVKGVVTWFSGLFGKIKGWLASIDWANVGKTIGEFVWEALTFIPKAIWNWLTTDGKKETKSAGGELVANLAGAIWEAIKGIGSMLWNAGKEIINGITEWWSSWTWEDVKQGVVNLGNNIQQWLKEVQEDPDVREFSLDLREGLEDTAYDVQDWFYELGTDIDLGLQELAANLNQTGSGNAVGAGIVSGVAGGIRSAADISTELRAKSEEALAASAAAVEGFDMTQMDQSYATHTAHWINLAAETGKGVINSLVGAVMGGVEQGQQESDTGITTYFANMFVTAKNELLTFKNNFILQIKKAGAFFKDVWTLITNPEELRKREKEEAAKDAAERLKTMKGRLALTQLEAKDREKIHKDRQAAMKQATDDALKQYEIGQEGFDLESGNLKSKRKVADEKKFIEGEWLKGLDRVADRAKEQAKVEQAAIDAQVAVDKQKEKMDKMRADVEAAGGSTPEQEKQWEKEKERYRSLQAGLEGASGAAKGAKDRLAGAQKGIMDAARKAGLNSTQMEGLKNAIAGVVDEERVRAEDKKKMGTEAERIAAREADVAKATAEAAATAAEAEGKSAEEAKAAGEAAMNAYIESIDKKLPEVEKAVTKVKESWKPKPGEAGYVAPTPKPVPGAPPAAPEVTGMGNVDALIESAKKKLQWFAENPQEIGYMIHDALAGAWDWATSNIIDPLKGLWDKFTGGKGGVGGVADGVRKYVIDPFMETLSSIPGKITEFFSSAVDWFSNIDPAAIGKAITDWIQRVWDWVKAKGGAALDWFSGIGDWLGKLGSGIAKGRPEAAPGAKPTQPGTTPAGITVPPGVKPAVPGAAPVALPPPAPLTTAGTAPVDAKKAGASVGQGFAAGIQESAAQVDATSKGVAKLAADTLTASSPIMMGPLKDVGAGGKKDPAFAAGMNLMQSFASGIASGASLVAGAVATMLQQSVFATIDAAQIQMQQAAAKKGLLAQVAQSLVAEFGAKGQITPTAQVGPDKKENVKETMKAMLSVPGLAAITMAIINESAKQLNVLSMIEANTKDLASTVKKDAEGGPKLQILGG